MKALKKMSMLAIEFYFTQSNLNHMTDIFLENIVLENILPDI